MTEKDANQMPVSSLAYLGDAVLEVLVRRKLVCDGQGKIHERAADYVTAVSQSAAAEMLLPLFSEEEADIYRRGRNSTHTAPKSATHAQYSRATGLECVFGYLYLSENNERISYLFRKGFEE